MNKPILILLFLLSFSFLVRAQSAVSSDELFKDARNAAFQDNNYSKARQLARQALAISPAYADIEILLGRLYTWDKHYDSARYHFSKFLSADTVN